MVFRTQIYVSPTLTRGGRHAGRVSTHWNPRLPAGNPDYPWLSDRCSFQASLNAEQPSCPIQGHAPGARARIHLTHGVLRVLLGTQPQTSQILRVTFTAEQARYCADPSGICRCLEHPNLLQRLGESEGQRPMARGKNDGKRASRNHKSQAAHGGENLHNLTRCQETQWGRGRTGRGNPKHYINDPAEEEPSMGPQNVRSEKLMHTIN